MYISYINTKYKLQSPKINYTRAQYASRWPGAVGHVRARVWHNNTIILLWEEKKDEE